MWFECSHLFLLWFVLSICCLKSSFLPWGHEDIGFYFFLATLRFDCLTDALNHLELILVCTVRFKYISLSRWVSTCPSNISWMVQLSPLYPTNSSVTYQVSINARICFWALYPLIVSVWIPYQLRYYSFTLQFLFSKASLSPHTSERLSLFLPPLASHRTFRISNFILKGCWDFDWNVFELKDQLEERGHFSDIDPSCPASCICRHF